MFKTLHRYILKGHKVCFKKLKKGKKYNSSRFVAGCVRNSSRLVTTHQSSPPIRLLNFSPLSNPSHFFCSAQFTNSSRLVTTHQSSPPPNRLLNFSPFSPIPAISSFLASLETHSQLSNTFCHHSEYLAQHSHCCHLFIKNPNKMFHLSVSQNSFIENTILSPVHDSQNVVFKNCDFILLLLVAYHLKDNSRISVKESTTVGASSLPLGYR